MIVRFCVRLLTKCLERKDEKNNLFVYYCRGGVFCGCRKNPEQNETKATEENKSTESINVSNTEAEKWLTIPSPTEGIEGVYPTCFYNINIFTPLVGKEKILNYTFGDFMYEYDGSLPAVYYYIKRFNIPKSDFLKLCADISSDEALIKKMAQNEVFREYLLFLRKTRAFNMARDEYGSLVDGWLEEYYGIK